jgi:thymidine phosphorylase
MKIKHFSDAEKVAQKFIQLGKHFNMKIIADINESLEPCGRGVGPYLEARDVLSVLEQRSDRPLELEAKALRLAGKLLDICYQDSDQNKNGEDEAHQLLKNGIALKKFQEIVKAQGGINNISFNSLKSPAHKKIITGKHPGKIKEINNYNLNTLAKILGAPADKYAGIYLLKKLDEKIEKNEPMLEFYSQDHYKIKEAEITLENFPIYQVE